MLSLFLLCVCLTSFARADDGFDPIATPLPTLTFDATSTIPEASKTSPRIVVVSSTESTLADSTTLPSPSRPTDKVHSSTNDAVPNDASAPIGGDIIPPASESSSSSRFSIPIVVGVALLAVLTVIAVILAAYRVRQHRQAHAEMLYDVGSIDGSTDWRSTIAASTFGSNSSARSDANLIQPGLPISQTMTDLLRSGELSRIGTLEGGESDAYGSVAYSVTLEGSELGDESTVDAPLETFTTI
eukprot:m.47193 g.47193  ORF g.47193 m.47193 type:complete len:243 (-) comp13209_c0_seq1:1587-2315(-)